MALVLIGIALLLWVILRARRYRKAKTWVRVPGTIVEIQVERRRKSAWYISFEYLFPHVRYEYEVDGKEYVGSRVSFDELNEGVVSSSSQLYFQRWVPNCSVDVYVRPDEPSQSVLVPGLLATAKGYYLAVLVGGALFLIGGAWSWLHVA